MLQVVSPALLHEHREFVLALLMYGAEHMQNVHTREGLIAALVKNSQGFTEGVWNTTLNAAISRGFIAVHGTGENECLLIARTQAAAQHAAGFSPYISTSAWFVAAADAEFRKKANAR